jgi:hypothetical protein
LSCTRIQDLISPLLEGDLRADSAALVTAHLDACPACRRQFVLMRRTIAALDGAPRVAPPSGLWEGVARQITTAPGRRQSLAGWLATATAFAATTAALAAVFVQGPLSRRAAVFQTARRTPPVARQTARRMAGQSAVVRAVVQLVKLPAVRLAATVVAPAAPPQALALPKPVPPPGEASRSGASRIADVSVLTLRGDREQRVKETLLTMASALNSANFAVTPSGAQRDGDRAAGAMP